jgi:hypothetical protein
MHARRRCSSSLKPDVATVYARVVPTSTAMPGLAAHRVALIEKAAEFQGGRVWLNRDLDRMMAEISRREGVSVDAAIFL